MTEQHHTVSHHGNDQQKIAQNVKVNTYHMGLFAKFIAKLQALPDGDGSVLDHSLIFYGGGMGNPNGHASDPLPVVAVGGGVGKGHRHLQLKPRTPDRQPVAGRVRTSSAAASRRSATATAASRGSLPDRARLAAGGGWLVAAAVARVLAGGADSAVQAVAGAIQAGDRAAVRALLAKPAEVRATDADGTTPLHWAVRADDVADLQRAPEGRRQAQRRQPVRDDAAGAGRDQRQHARWWTCCWRPAPTRVPRCRGARPC